MRFYIFSSSRLSTARARFSLRRESIRSDRWGDLVGFFLGFDSLRGSVGTLSERETGRERTRETKIKLQKLGVMTSIFFPASLTLLGESLVIGEWSLGLWWSWCVCPSLCKCA